jgi:pyruvate dehydrogenase E2 component (dihydrolipoamide acetyltransferase)
VDEGILAKIMVPEGTSDVPVNELIALIAGEGEDPKSVTGPSGSGDAAASPAPGRATGPRCSNGRGELYGRHAPGETGHRGRRRRRSHFLRPHRLRRPRAPRKPRMTAPAAAKPERSRAGRRDASSPRPCEAPRQGSGPRPRAGSGLRPHGRVVERDVRQASRAAREGRACRGTGCLPPLPPQRRHPARRSPRLRQQWATSRSRSSSSRLLRGDPARFDAQGNRARAAGSEPDRFRNSI